MSDEREPRGTDAETDQREAINLDAVEHEPTGDPLLDRGMRMNLDELEEAIADPDHPDHEAAKAANPHIGKKLSGIVNTVYGDQFRRISENLAAALKPNLGNLFSAPMVESFRAEPVRAPVPDVLGMPDPEESEVNETPQETLEALLEVSERMSETVRVSAEHRDVAVHHITHFKSEAEASRKSERRMLWLMCLALIGTWVAVSVALVSL